MAACSEPARGPVSVPAGCRHHDTRRGDEARSASPAFATANGLRALLDRLHRAGPDGWRDDAEAEALLRFVADRYAALARKHHQTPADAAAAAFPAMRTRAIRTATDPWAVVTTAVRKALVAEQRAEGLLTSAGRVRRSRHDGWHDAERFSDRAGELADDHPTLQHHDDPEDATEELSVVGPAAIVVSRCGWPLRLSVLVTEHICTRLIDVGSRHTAYETLRRDKTARVHFDLPHHSWIAILRATLGHPTGPGPLRHGTLARLLAGTTVTDLLADADLVGLLTDGRPAAVVEILR